MPVLRNSITGGIGGRRGGVDAPNYSADTGAGMIGSAIHSMANAYGDGIRARARVDQFKIDQQAKRSKEVREAIEYFGESAVRMGKELDKSADRQAETDAKEEILRYKMHLGDIRTDLLNTPVTSTITDEEGNETAVDGPLPRFLRERDAWDISHLSKRARKKFEEKRIEYDATMYTAMGNAQRAFLLDKRETIFNNDILSRTREGLDAIKADGTSLIGFNMIEGVSADEAIHQLQAKGYPINDDGVCSDENTQKVFDITRQTIYANHMSTLIKENAKTLGDDTSDIREMNSSSRKLCAFFDKILGNGGIDEATGIAMLSPEKVVEIQKMYNDAKERQKISYDTDQWKRKDALKADVANYYRAFFLNNMGEDDPVVSDWKGDEALMGAFSQLSPEKQKDLTEEIVPIHNQMGLYSFEYHFMPKLMGDKREDAERALTMLKRLEKDNPEIFAEFTKQYDTDGDGVVTRVEIESSQKRREEEKLLKWNRQNSRYYRSPEDILKAQSDDGVTTGDSKVKVESISVCKDRLANITEMPDKVAAIRLWMKNGTITRQNGAVLMDSVMKGKELGCNIEHYAHVLSKKGFMNYLELFEKDANGAIKRTKDGKPVFAAKDLVAYFPTSLGGTNKQVVSEECYQTLIDTLYEVDNARIQYGWSDEQTDKYLVQLAESTLRDVDDKISEIEADQRVKKFRDYHRKVLEDTEAEITAYIEGAEYDYSQATSPAQLQSVRPPVLIHKKGSETNSMKYGYIGKNAPQQQTEATNTTATGTDSSKK